jgi:hypothetical protein
MSEAVRAVALAEATKLKGDTGDVIAVLEVAGQYLNFLQGANTGPATRTVAGAEPEKKAESKPSANTAGAKKPTAAEKKAAADAAAAKAALEAAEAEGGSGDESTGPTEAFTADAAGVAAAVAAMIENKTGEGPDRDTAITLLKEFKAASVSAMQKQPADKVAKFISKVNEAFGLTGSEPDLEG